jgi:hypothetical protein
MSNTQIAQRTCSARRYAYFLSRVRRVVKKTAPVESPVARIGPVKIQLQLARFLEWTGIYGDVTEGTHHGRKLTDRDDGMRQGPKAQKIRAIT